MKIVKTLPSDLSSVMEIYQQARQFMIRMHNPNQWGLNRPSQEVIAKAIEQQDHYTCLDDDGKRLAVFIFRQQPDITYAIIQGAWLNDQPYGVIHALASARIRPGAAEFCLNWAFEQCHNLRIDTHQQNQPMRQLLQKNGFVYCGIIYTDNQTARLAYQKIDTSKLADN